MKAVNKGAGNSVFEVGASGGGPEMEGNGKRCSKRDKTRKICDKLLGDWGSNSTSVKSCRSVGNPKERDMIIQGKRIHGGRSMRSPGGDCCRKLGYRDLVGRIQG